MSHVTAAILAAGASTRMGTPKQLLRIGDETLLELAVEAAAKSKCSKVIVILGANKELISTSTARSDDVSYITNLGWQEGIASSIRLAVSSVADEGIERSAIILMTCDQPFVSSKLLDNLIMRANDPCVSIVACAYDGTVGIPALFKEDIFPELLSLAGDVGAKSVIKKHAESAAMVEFAKGAFDIDTHETFTQFLSTSG